mmetsp:Transcript_19829/g.44007  ORF Transcript_19829/g.44007 Transcript_19829/m.44007 type:complete len:223 (-) Transcript_19829:1668-2336(-)
MFPSAGIPPLFSITNFLNTTGAVLPASRWLTWAPMAWLLHSTVSVVPNQGSSSRRTRNWGRRSFSNLNSSLVWVVLATVIIALGAVRGISTTLSEGLESRISDSRGAGLRQPLDSSHRANAVPSSFTRKSIRKWTEANSMTASFFAGELQPIMLTLLLESTASISLPSTVLINRRQLIVASRSVVLYLSRAAVKLLALAVRAALQAAVHVRLVVVLAWVRPE